jgi:hypothetical protein
MRISRDPDPPLWLWESAQVFDVYNLAVKMATDANLDRSRA